MCFSEQASFSAAAALSLLAIGCFRVVKKRSEFYPLALIPLFFALQQAAEGFEWLQFKGIWGSKESSEFARNIFIFFAYCFWPLWLPLSLYIPEKIKERKQLLLTLVIAGFAYAIHNAWQLFTAQINAAPVDNSIQYQSGIFLKDLWLYIILVISPWFISSLPKMAIVGTVYAISCAIAAYAYIDNFTSVWCFFAAIITIVLIFSLRASCNQK